MNSSVLYYTQVEEANFSIYLAASDKGLCFVGNDFSDLEIWAEETFGRETSLIKNDKALKKDSDQFIEYFKGRRKSFDLPLHFIGTAFRKKVWQALLTIPYGHTMTYGELAHEIGKTEKASRAVGGAVGKNPLMVVAPCHRVIGKSGSLTGYRGGIQMKKDLLNLESETKHS